MSSNSQQKMFHREICNARAIVSTTSFVQERAAQEPEEGSAPELGILASSSPWC